MRSNKPKLTPDDLRQYQWRALRFIINNPVCALFLDMGLGKTVSTLSAIKHLYHAGKIIKPVLIVAPIRVIKGVWRQEALKWDHTTTLSFSLVHGNAKQRTAALQRSAHIYLINPEGIAWLVNHYYDAARNNKDRLLEIWPFEMLVVDESTYFKEGRTQRFKLLRKVLPLFKRRVILTGTPTPNSLLQLWSQMYIVDLGARLGTAFSTFRDRFFQKVDWQGFHFELRNGAKEYIERLIRKVTLRLEDKDWLELPPLINDFIRVDLPPRARDMYDTFEKEMFLELETAEVEAVHAAVLTTKCHQISNGAIYANDKETGAKDWYVLHDAKIEALKEYLEEIGDARCLIAYTFKHDLARLRALLPEAPILTPQNTERIVQEWAEGKHKNILMFPRSAGHGINDLQIACRRICFFSMPWSGEQYAQVIARVGPARRAGQKSPTIVHHIIANRTIDEVIVSSQVHKAATQKDLLDALKRYRDDQDDAPPTEGFDEFAESEFL